MIEFKDRLEQALTMRNMKPADLARLTGIGEGAISQYRKGAYKATQRNLEKISKVLSVSIPWLMGADDGEKPTSVSESGHISKDRKYLIDSIQNMSDENVHKLRVIVEQVIDERGQ